MYIKLFCKNNYFFDDWFIIMCTFGFPDHHISPQFPPITGYTGHIPRLKGTEASLSQTYCSSAKRGLAILYQV